MDFFKDLRKNAQFQSDLKFNMASYGTKNSTARRSVGNNFHGKRTASIV